MSTQFGSWADVVAQVAKAPGQVLRGVQITPALATEALGDNRRNRPVRLGTVKRYAHALSAGLWNQTLPQIALLYQDGTVADGGHRFSAVALLDGNLPAGLEFDLYLVNEVLGQDEGLRRNLSDFLSMDGVENPKDTAAVTRRLYMKTADPNDPPPGNSALRSFFNQHREDIRQAVDMAIRIVAGILPENLVVSRAELGSLYLGMVTTGKVPVAVFEEKMRLILGGGGDDLPLQQTWKKILRIRSASRRGARSQIVRLIEAAIVSG